MTYNDIDKELVNFFFQLREHPEVLIEKIHLTLYSREELALACEPHWEGVERARRFFVRVSQSMNGVIRDTNAKRWKRTTKSLPFSLVSEVWKKRPAQLVEVVEQLRGIQIENKPALQIIEDFDTDHTFFYCDPPYLLETRTGGKAYSNEMDMEDHIVFLNSIDLIQGKAMISGYQSEMYDNILANFTRIDAPEKYMHASGKKKSEGATRQECVWINYDPPQEGLI